MKRQIQKASALLLAAATLSACTGSPAASSQATSSSAAVDAASQSAQPAQTTAPQSAETAAVDPAYTWDLTEYFADDAAFSAELEDVETNALPAARALLPGVQDASSLLNFLRAKDALLVRCGHLSNYARQKNDLDISDAGAKTQYGAASDLLQEIVKLDNALANRLLGMDDAFWASILSDESLASYRRPLSKIREDAAHTLSDDQEALLTPSQKALNGLSDMFSVLNYGTIEWKSIKDPDGNEVVANYINYLPAMGNADREYRKAYYEAFADRYEDYSDAFAQNLSTYTALNEQLAKQHHYDSVLDKSTSANEITPEIYDALIAGARSHTEVLQRQNDLRKATLGYDKLYVYDLHAPLGNATAPTYTYADAQKLLEAALAPLGQDYVGTLDTAFKNRWIDVYPADGKATGAYAGMSVDLHPWVLTNFTGDYNSVSTLAHEMGHAMNQYRSYQAQDAVYTKGPTSFVSEVTSTTNELLLSRYMIAHAKSDSEKLFFVQKELDTLNSTFFGQVQYADVEEQFHKLSESGETLTADSLNTIYQNTYKLYEPGVEWNEAANSFWAAVPHFYYNYYVFAYAVDIAVACEVADKISNGDAAMLASYQAFIAAGDSDGSVNLFKTLGADITDDSYLEPLIARYNELLDMEEALLKKSA